MKSLKDYSLNLPEQEYHDLPYWSYSVIAKYAKEGFSSLATLHEKFTPTPSMEFGSLFDSFMTKGKQTLDDYVVDDTTAPPAEKAVYDWLLSSGHKEPFESISTEEITRACESCKFYPSYKPETRMSKLNASSKYYDVRRLGKKLVSSTDWQDAIEMHQIFRSSPYLKKLFGTKDTEDIEYIYQAQFKTQFVIEGEVVDVKIMPDLLVVNHKDKTIQPVDLKTSSVQAYDFSKNFIAFRYDIQAELYTDVIKEICKGDDEYKDYTVLPYLFTDISRIDKVPVTYTYDPSNGFTINKGDKQYTYKGWKELLSEILVYEENDAKVPYYIDTEGPNDLMDIINNRS